MDLNIIFEGVKKSALGADPIGSTLKFVFGEEIIHIDGTNGENAVTMEDKEAECLIIVSKEDFVKLSSGDLNPMMAVMTGKVKIKGDMGIAMKLQSLLG